ncbi:MAG: lipoyl(octanoyl) transferase LipB [Salibacteraceae bacterium]
MKDFEVINLGRMSYEKALAIQEARFEEIIDCKRKGKPHSLNVLYLVEHDPVYTLGKSGNAAHLINNPQVVGASFYRTNRGGDITYHGPGQIVGYPVFDLEQFGMGMGRYIHTMEEAIINVLRTYNLEGERLTGASGVWLDVGSKSVRKICAIGVKASRFVTMHGFAFNVNTDLSYFNHIIPCGIPDKGVTSLACELGREVDFEEAINRVTAAFRELFVVAHEARP